MTYISLTACIVVRLKEKNYGLQLVVETLQEMDFVNTEGSNVKGKRFFILMHVGADERLESFGVPFAIWDRLTEQASN